MLLRQRGLGALRILVRDSRNHASPNSGLPEAAMAGALGVQLGGPSCYDGQPLEKPTIGDPRVPLSARHIPAANALMLAAAMLFVAAGVAVRLGAVHLWHLWRAAA
jgi:adenosylcobinamide-phosphate synthase